jgi:putative transposase
MLIDCIAKVIRWYKGRCSFEIHQIHADFAWQPRFHDHIIRDATSFERIQTYIANNPLNWEQDKSRLYAQKPIKTATQ